MTLFDWLALALFILCWLGYGPLLTLLAQRSGTLNADMLVVRRVWMTAMTHREIRLVDSNLLGHTINSGGFFASTNLLLIAAVASVLSFGFISWESHRHQRLAQRVASRQHDLNSFPHPF